MTEYEMAVLSQFGETHRITIDDTHLEHDTVKDAISYAYWPIGGLNWWLTDYGEKPAVRVRWTRVGKDGRTIQYVKFYTNQRFRDFNKLREVTDYRLDIEDLNNILLGKDFVLYIEDKNGTMPELFENMGSLYDVYDGKHRHDMIINYKWVHRWDEDKTRQEFLSHFEGAKE